MPTFTPEKLREVMSQAAQIRNISVVAHVDSGKTTLTDAMLKLTGIISKAAAGVVRGTDTRKDETERGITIKSTGISLAIDYQPRPKITEESVAVETEKKTFVFNVVDSPGHVDFSAEVTAALRVTDGALVVIDCIEGVCVQTETVLRQALTEKVRPVLMINKIDRAFLELDLDAETAYLKMRKGIEDLNVLLATYTDPDLGEIQLDPRNGDVAFGSAYHQYGFTLRDFADFHARRAVKSDDPKKWIPESDRLIKYLWGDYWYDTERKLFTNKKPSPTAERGFVKLVWKPIQQLMRAVMSKNLDETRRLIGRLRGEVKPGVVMTKDEEELEEKKLAKELMRTWLPMEKCLTTMIIEKLPSPLEAQKYRAKHLYTGPAEGPTFEAIKNCDPDGPVVMYVSKMVPEKGGERRFWAFGRLLAGTIRTGTEYKIMGSNYVYGEKHDLKHGAPQRVVVMMGAKADHVDDVPAGNTCALVGLSKYLMKTGTISSDPDAYPVKMMKFAVSPVVQRAVRVKEQKDLKKLLDGLRAIKTSDPMVEIRRTDAGQNVIAGTGELHLEILLNDLSEYMGGAEIIADEPIVTYLETFVGRVEKPILAKSKNKHNHLHVVAEPMTPELATAIEDGEVVYRVKKEDEVARTRKLVELGLEADEATSKRLWAFGPTDSDPNLLINASSGVQYLDTVKDTVSGGFGEAAMAGPLTGSQMRGVIFKIVDAKLHADSVHRGVGEVLPAARRACFGAMLHAQPRLMEPIYLCTIRLPTDIAGSVYSLFSRQRGEVIDNTPIEGTPETEVKGYLPVRESFGFIDKVTKETSGKAYCQNTFSHYQVIDSDPYEEGTLAHTIVMEVRERDRLGPLPDPESYVDRM